MSLFPRPIWNAPRHPDPPRSDRCETHRASQHDAPVRGVGGKFKRRAASRAERHVTDNGAESRAPALQWRGAGRTRLADFLLEHRKLRSRKACALMLNRTFQSTLTNKMRARSAPDATAALLHATVIAAPQHAHAERETRLALHLHWRASDRRENLSRHARVTSLAPSGGSSDLRDCHAQPAAGAIGSATLAASNRSAATADASPPMLSPALAATSTPLPVSGKSATSAYQLPSEPA